MSESIRDPRVNPKAGDIFAGPIMRLRVDLTTFAIGGVLVSVVCSFSFKEPDVFAGSRFFTQAQFQDFVSGDKTEVIHAAD